MAINFNRSITINESDSTSLALPFILNQTNLNPSLTNSWGAYSIFNQNLRVPHEIVSGSEIWFNATTTLDGSTTLFMNYTKTGVNASFTPLNVWDNYFVVFHFEEDEKIDGQYSRINNSADGTNLTYRHTAGEPYIQDGRYGDALNAGDSNNDFIDLVGLGDTIAAMNDVNLTIGMWLKYPGGSTTGSILRFENGSGATLLMIETTGASFEFSNQSPLLVHTDELPSQVTDWWHFAITITTDGGGIYINGTRVNETGGSNLFTNLSSAFIMARSASLSSIMDMDEFFIYNGTMSDAQINATFQMGIKNYASLGAESSSIDIEVTLEDPVSQSIIGSSSDTFTCSANQAQAVNLDNVTFSLWDSSGSLDASTFRDLTDATTQNESFLITPIADDNYEWNCLYTDINNLAESAAANNSLTVDTIFPIINASTTPTVQSSVSASLSYTFTETNPQACWYTIDDGVTNNTFTSCGINTTATLNQGLNNVIFYINDTFGHESNDPIIVSIITGIEDITNQTNVLETTIQNFQVEVLNGSSILDSAILTYNNTAFPTNTFHSNGTSLFVNRSVTLNLFNLLQTNQSFFWNLTFIEGNDAVNLSTPIVDQIVDQMFIGNCSDGISTTQVLNFTVLDELTNNPLNATLIQTQVITWNRTNTLTRQLNFNTRTNSSVPTINGTSNFAYCISPNYAQFNTDYFVQFGLDGFETREYHVDSGILNTTQQNINLFLASLADAETITITVVDENGRELEGIVVEAHKKNIGDGSFNIVDIQETNSDGRVNMELIRGGNFYKFLFRQDGTLRLETSEFKLDETSYTFSLTIGGAGLIDVLSDINTITSTLTFNASGSRNFTFIWNDPANIADSFKLRVSNISFSNGTELTFEQSSTNQTGIIIFQIGNLTSPYTGTFIAQGFVTIIEDAKEHLLKSLTIEIREPERVLPEPASRDGLLFSFIVILTLFGIGMASGNPSIYIGLGVVSIWVMSLIGFISISTTIVVTLAIIGMFFIWRLKT